MINILKYDDLIKLNDNHDLSDNYWKSTNKKNDKNAAEIKKNWFKTADITQYKNIKDVKVNDKIFHVKYGNGIIEKLFTPDKYDDKYQVYIKFEDELYDNIYFLDVLLINNHILKINNKEIGNKILKIIKGVIKEEIEEEEEEIEEEEDDDEFDDDLTDDELLLIKIEDYFTIDELKFLFSLNDLKEYRNNLKNKINTKTNPFKDQINKKRLQSSYINEKYFKFLIKKFKTENVYKFTGKMPYDELWDIRKRDIIKFKNEYNYYIKDAIIYYWVFNNGIVFKNV